MNCGPIVDSITSSKWQLGDGGSSDKKATDRADSRLANFYSAMAYPGSQLYNLAVKERWLLPEKWSGYLQHSYDTSPLPTKYLSGPEVPRFRDNAFNVYFNDPRYLGMVGDKIGMETARDLKLMTKQKLERRYLGPASGIH